MKSRYWLHSMAKSLYQIYYGILLVYKIKICLFAEKLYTSNFAYIL